MLPIDNKDMEIVAPEGWAPLDRVVLMAADLRAVLEFTNAPAQYKATAPPG